MSPGDGDAPDRDVPDRKVAVGRITRAHGIRGEVSILVLSEVEDRFAPGSTLHLADGRVMTVESSRPHRARQLVKFREVPDRTIAETLAGQYLFVGEGDVPAAPEGAFWPHQLEGCDVVTESGRSLGRIREVVPGVANDLWVAQEEGEPETIVPALRDVVVDVDLQAHRVVVRDIPGLTAPEEPE